MWIRHEWMQDVRTLRCKQFQHLERMLRLIGKTCNVIAIPPTPEGNILQLQQSKTRKGQHEGAWWFREVCREAIEWRYSTAIYRKLIYTFPLLKFALITDKLKGAAAWKVWQLHQRAYSKVLCLMNDTILFHKVF